MSRTLLMLALVLAACGGGDSKFDEALAAAIAKYEQASALGVDLPCDQIEQCGNLVFHSPANGCGIAFYEPYSLVSATAVAASAAAAEQRDLADVSRALDKPYPYACPFSVGSPPALACVAGRCQWANP